tara:strand:- start:4179 stop:6128 length:1950 start_codon:yes stop_codon:yes gene_type:complete
MYIYDIEMYPNFFLTVFYCLETEVHLIFEISKRKDDTKKLASFLSKNKGCILIGFNNVAYDYQMLHYFILQLSKDLKSAQLVGRLFKKSISLGSAMKKGINTKIGKPLFKNIDLFLINHFNNKAKMVSLKELEFNMRMENIQELPFPFDTGVTCEQMDVLIEYCKHDVKATKLFYNHCLPNIEFRERMSELYGIDLTNANDVKIGEEILIDALSNKLEWEKEDIKEMRTYRNAMKIEEIVLSYISFSSEEFTTFLQWWKTKVIYETKGQFSKLPLEDVAIILPYTFRNFVSKNTKLEKLNIVYKDFQFDFGTGGIHGIISPGVWKANDDYQLILVDVSSYYPNLSSKNGFCPAHFPKDIFVEIVDMLYQQRMQGKEDGDMEIVKAIKLALNGALYGKSNDKFSCMYDPQMMMSICVNGQLLLVMLAEQFLKIDIEVVQINTDGILIYVQRHKKRVVDMLCNKWMKLTKLKLDYDHFDLVAQKDCNNYVARYTNGKIKSKGSAFSYKNLDWHKNHSALIIPRAVEAYFLDSISPEEFIPKHAENPENLYDFFLRAKLVKREYKLYGRLGEERHRLQKITRYFVAKEGMTLEKEMPPLKDKIGTRIAAIEKGFQVIPCNDLSNFNPEEIRNNLNYQYYIDKALKIIEACRI